MKTIIILLSSLLFTFTAYATNCHKEVGHSHDEVTTNGLSSGEITDNFININVNGMVCDFCAQSIEKVFMKRIEVKGINVNLEDQKVVIYLELILNLPLKVPFNHLQYKLIFKFKIFYNLMPTILKLVLMQMQDNLII